MNRCLITGCGGFIGSYLASLLLDNGYKVYGTVHQQAKKLEHLKDRITILQCDILDAKRVDDVVMEVKPDYIFHLAARSLITQSWQDPAGTFDTNITGTVNLLDSIRKAGIAPLVQILCSSAEYGFNSQSEIPIKEDEPFKPCSPYGVSKVGQDMLSTLYWRTYGMKIIRVRPFYITGPGKTTDACSDFARGIVRIEKGQSKTLSTGNLESTRDIVDVRDCTRALLVLMKRGLPGEVYNICTGRGYQMKELLDKLLSLTSSKVRIRQTPEKMRPLEGNTLVGDNTKLCDLGWKPRIPVEQTLSGVLDYWRKNMAHQVEEKCRL